MQNFSEKTWNKRPLEKPRRRWEYSIKIDIREIGRDSVEWILLVK
jgi:hypothetical protein